MSKYKLKIIKQHNTAIRFNIIAQEHPMSFQDVFEAWEHQPEFSQFYVSAVKGLGYSAFYWEHPALNQNLLHQSYECIILRSQPLERLAINERAFKNYIYSSKQVADFMNLGKNARLVIPTKKSDAEIYNHFGKFIRLAEDGQILALFKRVGKVVQEEIKKQDYIWLNTAGLGVIWLHVRMDTRPKYYKTTEYKNPDFLTKK